MSELLSDIVAAMILAAVATAVGPRLLPRLKWARAGVLFGQVFVITLVVGLVVTPLGAPLFDAAALVGAMFLTLGGALLMGARRGTVPPVVEPTKAAPGPEERRWAAVGVAFSYVWFAALFLVVVGLRWLAY